MDHMNPTAQELRMTEEIFFKQMQRLSQKASNPKLAECGWLHTFDFQFSDRWMNT